MVARLPHFNLRSSRIGLPPAPLPDEMPSPVGMARHCWRKARPLPRQPIRRADRRADKPSGCGVVAGKNAIPALYRFAEMGVSWRGVERGRGRRSLAPGHLRRDVPTIGAAPDGIPYSSLLGSKQRMFTEHGIPAPLPELRHRKWNPSPQYKKKLQKTH
jgi:hypothetical protein